MTETELNALLRVGIAVASVAAAFRVGRMLGIHEGADKVRKEQQREIDKQRRRRRRIRREANEGMR